MKVYGLDEMIHYLEEIRDTEIERHGNVEKIYVRMNDLDEENDYFHTVSYLKDGSSVETGYKIYDQPQD